MKNTKINKELEKILHAINTLDAKCNDTRLSLVYNFIMQLMDDGEIDMDYYNEELAKERECEEL